jgi:hypothetical protein
MTVGFILADSAIARETRPKLHLISLPLPTVQSLLTILRAPGAVLG